MVWHGLKNCSGTESFSRVDSIGWEQVDLTEGIKSTLNLVRHEVQNKADVVCEFAVLPPVGCVLSQIEPSLHEQAMNAGVSPFRNTQ